MTKCKYCWIRDVKKQWEICWTCQGRYKKAIDRQEILKANQISFKLSNSIKKEIEEILEMKKENIKKTNRNRYLYTLIYLIDILTKKDKEMLIRYYFKVKDIVWPINHFIEKVMISKWYDKTNQAFKQEQEDVIEKNKNNINTIQLLDMLKKITKAFEEITIKKEEDLIIELWNKWFIDNEEDLEKIMWIIWKYKNKITSINKKRITYNKQYYNIITSMLKEINHKDLQKIFYKSLWWYFQYVYTEIKPITDLIISK